jgi:hypothetical protein
MVIIFYGNVKVIYPPKLPIKALKSELDLDSFPRVG